MIFHYIIVVLLLVYIFFKKRNFEFHSVAILSTIFYSLPLLFGKAETADGYYISSINFKAYIVIDLVLILLFLSMLYYDKNLKYKNLNRDNNKRLYILKIKSYLILILIYVSFVSVLNRIGLSTFLIINKKILGGISLGIDYKIFTWGASISLFIGYYIKNKGIILFSMFPIFFSLFVGSRAVFVISFLSIILLKMSTYKIQLKKFKKIIFSSFFLFLFTILYKEIYKLVKQFEFSEILKLLFKLSTYEEIFKLKEVINVFSILNLVIEKDYRIGLSGLTSFINIIPFSRSILGLEVNRFANLIMENLYYWRSYGIASNIWAQFYSIGNLLGVFVFLVFWIIIIHNLSNSLINKINFFYYIIPFGVYSTFYIQRLDLNLLASTFRIFLIIFIFTEFSYLFFIKNYIKLK